MRTLIPLTLVALGLTLVAYAIHQGAAPTLTATSAVAFIAVGLLKDFDQHG